MEISPPACLFHPPAPCLPGPALCPLPLCPSVQRFAQSSLFKRTVLEHIAADLLAMHFAPEPSTHGGAGGPTQSSTGHAACDCCGVVSDSS